MLLDQCVPLLWPSGTAHTGIWAVYSGRGGLGLLTVAGLLTNFTHMLHGSELHAKVALSWGFPWFLCWNLALLISNLIDEIVYLHLAFVADLIEFHLYSIQKCSSFVVVCMASTTFMWVFSLSGWSHCWWGSAEHGSLLPQTSFWVVSNLFCVVFTLIINVHGYEEVTWSNVEGFPLISLNCVQKVNFVASQ